MEHSQIFTLFNYVILILRVCYALDCSNPHRVIDVNQSGKKGSFTTIQSAIDSIPEPNTQWTHIHISEGTYAEGVYISNLRSCIFLKGAGSSSTFIQHSDYDRMRPTSTFASLADNIVANGITFQNSYNNPPIFAQAKDTVPALTARIQGDKTAFYNCSFKGVQDTIWDVKGRHYFKDCYIQGAIDFIFGDGQSIYEKCVINFTMGIDGAKRDGTITAQKRDSIDSPTGFVFNKCFITGVNGRTQLGRAYGPFSRVIFANSYLTDVVRPEGWSAWKQEDHIANLTYVEESNKGPGANKSKRVDWMKHMDAYELNQFLNITYIDKEGWINNQPTI